MLTERGNIAFWHSSPALLSPSTLSLITTMISFHLSTEEKLCVIIVPVTHRPAAILTNNTGLNRPRCADPRRASVTHLPCATAHIPFVPSMCNSDSYKGMEKYNSLPYFYPKTCFLHTRGVTILYSPCDTRHTGHNVLCVMTH